MRFVMSGDEFPVWVCMWGSECQRRIEMCSESLKRRMLRIMYGPVTDNGIGKTGYNDEPDALYDVVDTGRMAKTGGIEVAGTPL